jgi:hypothetical protein
MDVLTFIPGVGQLISFIGSGVDFFLQGKSQLWNVNKTSNAIRLQNANWEAEWNPKKRLDVLFTTRNLFFFLNLSKNLINISNLSYHF